MNQEEINSREIRKVIESINMIGSEEVNDLVEELVLSYEAELIRVQMEKIQSNYLLSKEGE